MIKTSMLKWHKGQLQAHISSISPTSGDVHLCMKGKIFNEEIFAVNQLLPNGLLLDLNGVIIGDVGAISNISSSFP